jgi:hypothetical protein
MWHMMGLCKWLDALFKPDGTSYLVLYYYAGHSILAKLSFLLGTPPYPLETSL